MSNICLEESKDGYEISKVINKEKEYYIGSKYNMKREIDKFIDEINGIGENDTYIILGIIGMAAIEELKKRKFKESKIIIVEVKEEFLNEIQNESKYKKILKEDDVKILFDKIELKKYLVEEIIEDHVDSVKIISFGKYNKIFNDELIESYKIVKDVLLKKILNKNTKMLFKKDWLINDLNNAKEVFKSQKINEIKGRFKDKPLVIVSAGPSLSKNIRDIEEEKSYIISGGRTLKSLLMENINPDMINVVDGGEASYELVEDYIEKINSTLFYTEMTNYKVVKKHKGKKVIAAQGGVVKKICNGQIEDIVVGGSVANSMAYIGGYLGFNPIIFVGQDLAYTDDKGHAKIANYKNNNVDAKNGYFKENDVWVKDIYGNDIRTSIVLRGFRDSMEEIIEMFPDTKFIDATEGGALIKGTEIKNLKEVMQSLQVIEKEEVGRDIEDLRIKEDLKKYILNSKKEMKDIIQLASKGIKKLNEFKRLYKEKKDLTKANEQLDKIEKTLNKKIKKVEIINSLLYSLIFKLENEESFVCKENDTVSEKREKRFNMNLEIYEGMIRICKITLEEIEKIYSNY